MASFCFPYATAAAPPAPIGAMMELGMLGQKIASTSSNRLGVRARAANCPDAVGLNFFFFFFFCRSWKNDVDRRPQGRLCAQQHTVVF